MNRNMVRSAGAVALAVLLTACQLGPRPLAVPPAAPSGEWAVVNVRMGASIVRNPAAAMARIGQLIRYEPTLVLAGESTCQYPQYVASDMLAERYLFAEFGVHTADLGLYRWQDVRITEVFCNGRKWKGLGADAFWIDHDRGYAVKDDVLYELRRTSTAYTR